FPYTTLFRSELGHHLTHDEDALGFESIQMRDTVGLRLAHGDLSQTFRLWSFLRCPLRWAQPDFSGYRQMTLQRCEQSGREILAADHQIRQLRIGLVVF